MLDLALPTLLPLVQLALFNVLNSFQLILLLALYFLADPLGNCFRLLPDLQRTFAVWENQ